MSYHVLEGMAFMLSIVMYEDAVSSIIIIKSLQQPEDNTMADDDTSHTLYIILVYDASLPPLLIPRDMGL